MAHRGPDGSGAWSEGEVAFGHRRLAVLDPSAAGAQPMLGSAGDVIVFNGEIYNHLDLRRELANAGALFSSRSDTETILRAYEIWGTSCFARFDGMFAIAIWDRRRRELILARDRFGVKPLYIHERGGLLVAASEIKAILAHPTVGRGLDPGALGEYLGFQNILSERTLFQGVTVFPPGEVAVYGERTSRFCYWQVPWRRGGFTGTSAEAVGEISRTFAAAVKRQLLSDVPIGSFLSGGIDSCSIVAVASRELGRIRTFTGGFDLSSASGLELVFDERQVAERVSYLCRSEHYEMVMHAGDMEQVMPDLIWHLEDLRVGQCYPNYYISRLASKFVKVALSGCGGDEIFGGYPWRYAVCRPQQGRAAFLDALYRQWLRLTDDAGRDGLLLPEVARATAQRPPREVFEAIFPTDLDLSDYEGRLSACLAFEQRSFLHGLLVVEDRVSMAHSLETRVPFLDHALVDLAGAIPASWHVDLEGPEADLKLMGKRLLRQAVADLVPEEVARRGKQGFSAPDASWFRGESIDYVNRLLRDPEARIFAYLDYRTVGRFLDEHTQGRHNHRLLIWSLTSLEWWLRRFLP